MAGASRSNTRPGRHNAVASGRQRASTPMTGNPLIMLSAICAINAAQASRRRAWRAVFGGQADQTNAGTVLDVTWALGSSSLPRISGLQPCPAGGDQRSSPEAGPRWSCR